VGKVLKMKQPKAGKLSLAKDINDALGCGPLILGSSMIYENDCTSVLDKMTEDSVDLIVTDPPFALGLFMKNRSTNLGQMRDNFFGDAKCDDLTEEEWTELMNSFLQQAYRVLKPGGAAIIFMSILRIESLSKIAHKYNFYYKTTGIWHKTNPMPRNMNLHFINSTESWLYILKPQSNGRKTGTFNNEGKAIHDFIETSVISKSEKNLGKHPTQKPVGLMEHFITILSNPGDVVLDPFMGSGSTGVACIRQGRNFIGIEGKNEYFTLSESRLKQEINHG
jgi:DNA modification methylase